MNLFDRRRNNTGKIISFQNKFSNQTTSLIRSSSSALCACEHSRWLSSTPRCASWDSLVYKIYFSLSCHACGFLSALKYCAAIFFFLFVQFFFIIPSLNNSLFNSRHQCADITVGPNVGEGKHFGIKVDTFHFAMNPCSFLFFFFFYGSQRPTKCSNKSLSIEKRLISGYFCWRV